MLKGYTVEEIEGIHGVFALFDTDHSGSIDSKELFVGMK